MKNGREQQSFSKTKACQTHPQKLPLPFFLTLFICCSGPVDSVNREQLGELNVYANGLIYDEHTMAKWHTSSIHATANWRIHLPTKPTRNRQKQALATLPDKVQKSFAQMTAD
jgi:hypothetical protein